MTRKERKAEYAKRIVTTSEEIVTALVADMIPICRLGGGHFTMDTLATTLGAVLERLVKNRPTEKQLIMDGFRHMQSSIEPQELLHRLARDYMEATRDTTITNNAG